MIGTVECRVTAHRPNQPLSPIFTYVGSPSNMRIIDVPKGIGQFKVDVVKVVVDYPNNKKEIVEAVRQGSVYVATIPSCEIAGKTTGGVEIICDCTDENGNPVEGFVIGKGDVFVLERDSKFSKLVEKSYVKYVDELPTTPAKGDIVYHNSTLQMFDGTQWLKFGDQEAIDELAERVEALNEEVGQVKDDITSIETKIEDIEGDIVEVKESIPTKTSELENDSITPQSIGAAPIYAPFIRESLTVGQPNMPCVKMWVGDYESGARLDLTVEGGANVGGTINVEGEGAQILINNKQVATIDLINQEIKNPQGLEAGKTLQVVEVEDEPVARGASLQSVSPRATSTHLEWAAVDPITKTSQLDNDSEFVDKDFVNSSIATNTANFKGTFNNESEFPTEATNNDYLFWKTVDENGNTIYKRYKYIASTSTWTYEYTLNNSSFTAEQWATINNGPYAKSEDIPTKTSELTNDSGYTTYDDIPTNVSELENDSGYITQEDVENKRDKTDLVYDQPIEYGDFTLGKHDIKITTTNSAIKSGIYKVSSVDGNMCHWKTEGGSYTLYTGVPTPQSTPGNPYPIVGFTTPWGFIDFTYEDGKREYDLVRRDTVEVWGKVEILNQTSIALLTDIPNVPTKTSELSNDSGYITYDDIPTNVSELENDSGYQTSDEVDEKIEEAIGQVLTQEDF